MKRLVKIAIVAIVLVITITACSHSTCPAYSDNSEQQLENDC